MAHGGHDRGLLPLRGTSELLGVLSRTEAKEASAARMGRGVEHSPPRDSIGRTGSGAVGWQRTEHLRKSLRNKRSEVVVGNVALAPKISPGPSTGTKAKGPAGRSPSVSAPPWSTGSRLTSTLSYLERIPRVVAMPIQSGDGQALGSRARTIPSLAASPSRYRISSARSSPRRVR